MYYVKSFVALMGHLFGKVFHTRSIIIISARKTNHVALSGPLQFGFIAGLIACVIWASYSTGRYMATNTALEQRDQTIKSVANSRIDSNFSYTPAAMPEPHLGPVADLTSLSLTDPAYTLSAVNNGKLFARIAMLENKVRELKDTNAEIIQTVREKTQSKIINMEEIIRQTGLNVEALKGEAVKQREQKPADANAIAPLAPSQGGPFIPADAPEAGGQSGALTPDLDAKLDQLALLNSIIQGLPLGLPIPDGELHSNFGRRVDPFTGELAFHAGIDLSGPVGTQIHATGDGKVSFAGWEGAYGNAVLIDHGFGIVTRYGHLSSIGVKVGDIVKKGGVIGVQGSTGRSTGPHVHYEVRYYDRPLNPINFIHVANNVPQTQQ